MLKILSIGGAQIEAYLDKKFKKITTHVTGSAINTAKNYKAFGHPVEARLWLGEDKHGQIITNDLKKHHINSVISVIPSTQTPYTLYLVTGKNKNISLVEKENKLTNNLFYKDASLLQSTNWIHLSGLNCTPSQINSVFEQAFKKIAIPLTWSPGQRQITDGFHAFDFILKHTVILTINKKEILTFTHRKGFDRAIRDLFHTGVKIIVVTNHARAVQVITPRERFTILPPHGFISDYAGAGDRFASTFTSYAINTFDIPLAMQMATFHSHLLLMSQGADSSLMSKKALEQKFQREKKKYLVHLYEYL